MERIGRYRVEAEVARGGAAVVYRARDPQGRPVAVKLLRPDALSPAGRRRFELEVKTLLSLDHPGIVRALEAGEEGGHPWLALEWIEGRSLAERLRTGGPLPPMEAAGLVATLAEALAHCHARGLIHRDLSPANVLLRGDGRPLLTDFGLVKDAEVQLSLSSPTTPGLAFGTPGYWPPEQALGRPDAVDVRSDVYGLGAILFAALTGRAPQPGETLQEVLQALDQEPPSPRQLRGEVDPRLDAVCRRCLARDPSRRFPHARAVAIALRGAGAPGPARGGWLPWLAAAALIGASGALSVLLLLGPRRPVPGPEVVAPLPAPAASSSAALDAEGPLDAEGSLRRAEELARAGDRPAALAELDRAIALRPGLAEAWLARGQLRLAAGDAAGARSDLTRGLELGPPEARALLGLGQAKMTLGDAPGALEAADLSVALDPRDPESWNLRGVALRKLERPREALESYDRALQLSPREGAVFANRARLKEQLRDLRGAIEDWGGAVAADPRDGEAWFERGRLRFVAGALQEALADTLRATEVDPRRAGAWSNLGVIKRRLGDARGALPALSRAIELDPQEPSFWGNRGNCKEELLDLAGAVQDWTRCLELSPTQARIAASRARVRRKLGDLTGAIDDYGRELARDPENPELFRLRGECRQAAGDDAGARADLARAAELERKPPVR